MGDLIQVRDSVSGQVQVFDAARYAAFGAIVHNRSFTDSLKANVPFASARDADNALTFLQGQFTYQEQQIYEQFKQPYQYQNFLPVTAVAGEWAEAVAYDIKAWHGKGKRSAPGDVNDINAVDVGMDQKSFKIVEGKIGYRYTDTEITKAARFRIPLPGDKIQNAMDGFQDHMNDVGLFGEMGDLTGFYNNALVPQGSAPNGNWAATATTTDEILADINHALQQVWSATAYNVIPDTLVVAPDAYAVLLNRRIENTSTSLLTYFMSNNFLSKTMGQQLTIQPGYGLNTAGASSTKRLIAYRKDPKYLEFHIPLPLRFLAPQPVGLAVNVPGKYRYSGVAVRYPTSMFYMDGI